jgi:hypothetical protein
VDRLRRCEARGALVIWTQGDRTTLSRDLAALAAGATKGESEAKAPSKAEQARRG